MSDKPTQFFGVRVVGLEAKSGSRFDLAALEAFEYCRKHQVAVRFTFNGIQVEMSPEDED